MKFEISKFTTKCTCLVLLTTPIWSFSIWRNMWNYKLNICQGRKHGTNTAASEKITTCGKVGTKRGQKLFTFHGFSFIYEEEVVDRQTIQQWVRSRAKFATYLTINNPYLLETNWESNKEQPKPKLTSTSSCLELNSYHGCHGIPASKVWCKQK